METISLPEKFDVKKTGDNQAVITIEPCYPGYGNTLGNALRRVLLSSLAGCAVTAVKIKGITHEFSTIPGVKEDTVEIILNLKRLRFKLHGVDETTATLKIKGEKKVKAKDIKLGSELEIANPDAEVATLTTKDADLELELTIKSGRGYLPVENIEKRKLLLGTIAIDGIFTPVRNANFTVENVRVGQMTNYDKLIMSVGTDGTISPEEAIQTAAKILVEQFSDIGNFGPTAVAVSEGMVAEGGQPEKAATDEPAKEEEGKPKKKRAKAKKPEKA